MGPQENQPDYNPETAQETIRTINEELENLKSSIMLQLQQEIDQLQNRKTRLLAETEQLELQRQDQLTQQQQLAQQLAPVIAEQILEHLRDRLTHSTHQLEGVDPDGSLNNYNNNAHRLISSLDTTLRTTFRTLQQDLNSYQSSLSQQLGQMYNLEQQGEALLDALVDRLKNEFQKDTLGSVSENNASNNVGNNAPSPGVTPPTFKRPELPLETPPPQDTRPNIAPPTPQPPPTATPPKPKRKTVTAAQMRIGFLLVLFSSFALSLQNVVISIVLNQSSIFGKFETGQFISPGFGNSLLLLCMRMVVVVPLMSVLAQILYPSSWQEINHFLKSKDWDGFLKVIGCSFFLYISSAFIYMALGALTPGVALTLFFVFPIVTVLMSWLVFGERPSLVRSLATLTVFLGVTLIALPQGETTLSTLGISTALAAGITFAFHVLLIQACTKKLHPVPFSVLNFAVILMFSAISLLIPLPANMAVSVDPSMWMNLIISSLILGGLTLLSYLSNNIGISYIGAARASIIGSTGPALTSLLSWVIIAKGLFLRQLIGMLIVTFGVLGQNLERMYKKKPPQKPAPNSSRNGR